MIEYSHGRWGIRVLLQLRGSVLPKALVWSVPCAAVTVLLHLFWDTEKGDANKQMEGIDQIWSKFTFVLGFLIVFRSNQAYSRFWESVTLFHQISGEWMSAFSNLLSFCSADPHKHAAVTEFRQYLIRLMSLLHCNALQTLCELDDDRLEVVDLGGIGRTSLIHLKSSPDRCETVLLWLERFIIEADKNKTLDVPAPILSRAFQELSRGMVGVTNVRKIRDVPFPFPYSQFLSFILVVHWLITPIVASQIILKPWWAGTMVFAVTTSYWTLYYIAQEIDQPFGEDANDLPVREMQRHFNEKLEFFISPLSYSVPEFNIDASQHIQMLSSTFSVALSNSVAAVAALSEAAAQSEPEALLPQHADVESGVDRPRENDMNDMSQVSKNPSQHEIIEVTLAKDFEQHSPTGGAAGTCACTSSQGHNSICFAREVAPRENSEVSLGLPLGAGEGSYVWELEELKQLFAMLPREQSISELSVALEAARDSVRRAGPTESHENVTDPCIELSTKLDSLVASELLHRLHPDHQRQLRLLTKRLGEGLGRVRRV